MALTYVYLTVPGAQAVARVSGVRYAASSAGVITGVTAADALSLQGVNGYVLLLMAATGATADRPAPQPATALTGAPNNLNPAPTPGLAYYDTTTSGTVYYVGTQRSSTGWVDRAGTAA